eukprot:TRINITY_DN10015_c0_g1_i1.p1 TRINITY_DN10015_c0_g1~~TRINITY_DN10015_c0_g1_i1.p1  ORF type:complete len:551 (+),score=179.37 TRINITY_DN10015_c0_g1_i1:117-1769(+)
MAAMDCTPARGTRRRAFAQCAASPISAFASPESSCGTSPTRASSSPPTTTASRDDGSRSTSAMAAPAPVAEAPRTRRCLDMDGLEGQSPGREAAAVEVFDMAAGEEGSMQPRGRRSERGGDVAAGGTSGTSASTAGASGAAGACAVELALDDEAEVSATDIEHSTMEAEEDCWSPLADWSSPQSSQLSPGSVHESCSSICLSGSDGADATMGDRVAGAVAGAVFEELRRRLEPVVDRAVDGVTAWAAAEIAAARRSFEDGLNELREELKAVREAPAAVPVSAGSGDESSSTELRARFEEQSRDIKKLQEELRLSVSPVAQSANALELKARVQALEKQFAEQEIAWKSQLGACQAAVERQGKAQEALEEKMRDATAGLRAGLEEQRQAAEKALQASLEREKKASEAAQGRLEALERELAREQQRAEDALAEHAAWAAELSDWLAKSDAASRLQGEALRRHEAWMMDLNSWLEQVRSHGHVLGQVVAQVAADAESTKAATPRVLEAAAPAPTLAAALASTIPKQLPSFRGVLGGLKRGLSQTPVATTGAAAM